jgi:hypothetical protein
MASVEGCRGILNVWSSADIDLCSFQIAGERDYQEVEQVAKIGHHPLWVSTSPITLLPDLPDNFTLFLRVQDMIFFTIYRGSDSIRLLCNSDDEKPSMKLGELASAVCWGYEKSAGLYFMLSPALRVEDELLDVIQFLDFPIAIYFD